MALWTPAETTTAWWLDASDAATITLNGSTVSGWADKSGNTKNASQATASKQPAYNASALNGLAAVTPDGVDDYMTAPVIFPGTTPTDYFVIAALKTINIINSGDNTANMFFGQTGSTALNSNVYFNLAQAGESFKSVHDIYPPSGGSLVSSQIITANTNYLIGFGRSGTTRNIFVNGAQTATQTTSEAYSGTTINATNLFMLLGTNNAMNAYVGEIIAIPFPTTELRQILEGYLAHKWGFSASLAADHPYKSAAPTVSEPVVTLSLDQPISLAQIVALSLHQPIALRKLITMGLDQYCGLELAMALIQRCRAMPSVRLSLNQWLRDLRRVNLRLDQHIGVCPQIALALDQHLRMPFSPTLSLHQPVAIADQQIALSLVQPERMDIDGRVSLALGQPCAMTSDAALLQQIGLTVTVGGRIVEPDFVSLKTDDGGGFMVATIRFPDVQQYLPCRIGEAVVITELLDDLPAEVTVLTVETLTNPEEHGSADHILTAISQTVVLDDERLTDDLGPGVAAALMTALVAGYGISLDWQGMPGWPLAAGELVAEDETAYAVLVRLAAASGAFLQSLPDGTTIRLRPEYAVNVGAWPTAATALELNDQDHIFSLDESPDERDGYNSFLISGQSAAAGDYRLEDTAISATVKEVRCYQVPYRAASTIVLGHTGGDWVSIDYLGVHEELIKDEEVVVTAGLGRLQLPYYGGLAWSYKQDGLGTVTAEEDGSLATAQVGDALLDVNYTTKFRKWRLTDPKAESLQIYIDEVI